MFFVFGGGLVLSFQTGQLESHVHSCGRNYTSWRTKQQAKTSRDDTTITWEHIALYEKTQKFLDVHFGVLAGSTVFLPESSLLAGNGYAFPQ